MKTQMRFQKILSLVTLLSAVLCFVYTVAFLTGGMGNVHYYLPVVGGERIDNINAKTFLEVSQSFVDTLLVLSIIFILLVAFMYITATNSRRNYYITNYIAVGALVVFALVIAIYMIVGISQVMDLYFNDIAWEAGTNGGKNYADMFNENYPVEKSGVNFALGYVLSVIVILVAAANVGNLVWKIKLMKGEKALLENGLQKEIA